MYAGILAAAAWLIYFLFFTRTGLRLTHVNMRDLSEDLQALGPYALLLGMLAVFIQTLIPIVPFMLVAGANVLVFGLVQGVTINYMMACIGAAAAFFFARYYGHSWVEKKLDRYPAVLEFNKRLETHGFFYVLVGRLIPILPSTAINLGAGVSKIRVSHFILATLIGKLPIVYLESTIAHDMLHIHRYKGRLVLYVVIFLVLLYIGSLFKSKITGKSNSPKK
ncbi:TVP38/TMEM64 family protein [Paenibacillus aurantius]|uniref:TVP38/TMEM64 family membrane protein n=1 Tax=Paenibacillus aurantius TaxID=2918900 RepID=A0AA96LHZ8_9BACL|nr:TVP38/TMEM64 family protein [Paenibacillus aurantius]WNQ13639.1 TVP38/TMEM64 family protein [Paenibacillus aurantius]